MLADLQAAEFIYEQPALTDAEYIFKHALTQEVAYNSLLIGAPQALARARRTSPGVDVRRAVGRSSWPSWRIITAAAITSARRSNIWGAQGQQALQRSAHADAISSLNAAIDLLQRLPDSPERIQRELLLQLALGPALIAVKGWAAPEVERAYTRARELCERLGDPPELFPALLGLWAVYYLRGELRKAYELAEQLLRRAQSAHDPALLLIRAPRSGRYFVLDGRVASRQGASRNGDLPL